MDQLFTFNEQALKTTQQLYRKNFLVTQTLKIVGFHSPISKKIPRVT